MGNKTSRADIMKLERFSTAKETVRGVNRMGEKSYPVIYEMQD